MTLRGRWRIIAFADEDDPASLNLNGPAMLELDESGVGWLSAWVVSASVDARSSDTGFEFTFDGQWELDDISGRAVATRAADGSINIVLHLHLGDAVTLRAIPFSRETPKQ